MQILWIIKRDDDNLEKTEKVVVIGWQPFSRRSESFARHINASFHLIHFFKFKYPPIAPLKYILQSVKTFWILLQENPDFVIAENPPLFLPLVVFCYAKIFKRHFVIDAATGAFYDPKWKWLNFLFRFLARRAICVLVTNKALADIVMSWNAKAVVLEDKIPEIPATERTYLSKGFKIVVINSFSFDEPIEAILAAARCLPKVNFYVTGNTAYAKKNVLDKAPVNVRFTGFLKESAYFSLLNSSDAAMVLCAVDNTLCCGMYEAVSLTKPLIASDWGVIRNFFKKGAVYVKNTAEAIAEGVKITINKADMLQEEMAALKEEMNCEWVFSVEVFLRLIRKEKSNGKNKYIGN